MNPVRLRRLQADAEEVTRLFQSHPFISLAGVEGNPPEKYRIDYRVTGLVPVEPDGFRYAAVHRAEIFLTLDYPRRPPYCRMLTPVFHPNIDPQKICIGDHWSAGQSLVQLILRIGEMICFQSYNTKSPLNAKAAAWAEQQRDRLPLLKADLGAGV